MGVKCTKTNIKKSQISVDNDINKLSNSIYKNTNHITLNKSYLENFEFYKKTLFLNDYFITTNFENIKSFEAIKIKKFYEKWEQILKFTRLQKKFSYKNLNQNPNFIISTNEKKEFNCDNSEFFGRGSQIVNYVNKDKEYSTLIERFQISFCFNKYRYIKYLTKGPPNNLRWIIWLSSALCRSGQDFYSQEQYDELINKKDQNFQLNEENQIKKDLTRSNSNTNYFKQEVSLTSLYNILKAIAIDDPELGYCQGMNILAANFLLISDGNELETFNMLRFLFKHLELIK